MKTEPRTSRDRTRRYRERRLLGIRIVPAQIDSEMVQWLIDHDFLLPHHAGDRRKIQRALDWLMYELPRGERRERDTSP